MTKGRKVKCNHCDHIMFEDELDDATKPFDQECCPECGQDDALMDIIEAKDSP